MSENARDNARRRRIVAEYVMGRSDRNAGTAYSDGDHDTTDDESFAKEVADGLVVLQK